MRINKRLCFREFEYFVDKFSDNCKIPSTFFLFALSNQEILTGCTKIEFDYYQMMFNDYAYWLWYSNKKIIQLGFRPEMSSIELRELFDKIINELEKKIHPLEISIYHTS